MSKERTPCPPDQLRPAPPPAPPNRVEHYGFFGITEHDAPPAPGTIAPPGPASPGAQRATKPGSPGAIPAERRPIPAPLDPPDRTEAVEAGQPVSTVRTFHGDTLPACQCRKCSTVAAESVALRARARLLKQALLEDEPAVHVRYHALLLIQMMEARGMC